MIFTCKKYIITLKIIILKGSLQKLQYNPKICYHHRKYKLGSKKKILDKHLACFLCIYLLNTYVYILYAYKHRCTSLLSGILASI